MGGSQDKTLIIWIDKNVNNKPGKELQNEIRKYDALKLECFDNLENGIKCIQKIKFQKTLIILSGRLYPDFHALFKQIADDLLIIPKIIIFTGNANEYNPPNKNELNLKDKFYNIGGVIDKISELKKFIESSVDKFSGNYAETIKNEELKFQLVSSQNDLILPIYYSDYVNSPDNVSIIEFIKKIKTDYAFINPVGNILSQIPETNTIPSNLLINFWLRAYSTHLMSIKNLHLDEPIPALNEKDFNDYVPITKLLYQAVKNNKINSDPSKLYKGMYLENKVWDEFYKKFNEKANQNNIPKALLYGSSFFSFYKEEGTIEQFKRLNRIRNKGVFIFFILEATNNFRFVKNNAIINEKISYYEKKSDEVLFFPFSCFEIKTIELIATQKEPREYKIILNYLDRYKDLFHEGNSLFEDLPINDYSDMVFNSGIINDKLIKYPKWFTPFKYVLKRIKNNDLLEKVKEICYETISINNNKKQEDEIREMICGKLKNEVENGHWYVKICESRIFNFGNVDNDSLMIFYFDFWFNKLYVHVAKLNN